MNYASLFLAVFMSFILRCIINMFVWYKLLFIFSFSFLVNVLSILVFYSSSHVLKKLIIGMGLWSLLRQESNHSFFSVAPTDLVNFCHSPSRRWSETWRTVGHSKGRDGNGLKSFCDELQGVGNIFYSRSSELGQKLQLLVSLIVDFCCLEGQILDWRQKSWDSSYAVS